MYIDKIIINIIINTIMEELNKIKIKQKRGDEYFVFNGEKINQNVMDFGSGVFLTY